ncbi:Mediator of RNA polymerase II transcription subunit 16 [Cinnamomum micranthum f. kanehirae]|uniref:Mediator of RNA polymerase II transcription subunit 16 n=1 Tax=Cinnamomum micranthum f. kanehirae TaxID=337451 RepID=A0A3S3MB35_9MAGN|nr:Mediator of RNA polymerase II transcription subunit 16 [Cinnamomum micranthum f. kanehirae]
MTLAEKIGQMTQIDRSVASFDVIRDLSIESVLNGGDSAPSPDWTPSMWADMVDGYQRAALSSRLGIPMIYGTDAVHGHNNVFGSTVFPHNIGLGATRDADLVLRIGKATALEIRGTGIPYAFAPCLAYLLYGPLVAKALHSWVYEDGQRYSWCLHILIICALRGLIYQLWHSYGSMLFLTRNRMVDKQGVGYKQIDEEWDCSNANPPFWIPIHIVNPERPTECAIFNVIADSPRDSVQFMEWSPAPCPRALLIANFHGRITIWTQPSQGPVNLVRDASCWHCEHEWRQDLAVVTKWLAGMYPRHFVYTVMALLTCFVSMHLVCCVCQEQFALCFNRSANPEVVKQLPSLAAADHRWPLVTHFVGCKPCGKFRDYSVERCLKQMDRAFNFGDNQILQIYGFTHKSLASRRVKRICNDTSNPLDVKDELGLLHPSFKAIKLSSSSSSDN